VTKTFVKSAMVRAELSAVYVNLKLSLTGRKLGMLHRTGNRRRHTARNLKMESTMTVDNSQTFIPAEVKLTIDSREDVSIDHFTYLLCQACIRLIGSLLFSLVCRIIAPYQSLHQTAHN
jgi:hypothetical protein